MYEVHDDMNQADGIQYGLVCIANALLRLGHPDASPMGAIEVLGKILEDGMTGIADAISEGLASIADADESVQVSNSLDAVAEAIKEHE